MNPLGVTSGLFQTTADQQANTFQNGTNFAHMAPGWANNPAYQTPSYDAPYRPEYSGPSPYAAYQKPSWAGGVSQLVSPMYRDPYWGNPVDHTRQAVDAAVTKPFDALAWGGQRILAPALMFGMATKLTGGMGRSMGCLLYTSDAADE